MTLGARIVCFAVVAAGGQSIAQDDAAERLKALVDRRIEELRFELHRAIDLAFAKDRLVAPLVIELAPVSEEFGALHRLPRGTGAHVVRIDPAGATPGGIQIGDAVVKIGGQWVTPHADVGAAIAEFQRAGRVVILDVIRKGERTLVEHATKLPTLPPTIASTPRKETADQMVDRLWKKALREQAPVGFEPAGGAVSAPESRAIEKKPIPDERPRR
jgi:hypothetical protein